jgi:hypothetical protein
MPIIYITCYTLDDESVAFGVQTLNLAVALVQSEYLLGGLQRGMHHMDQPLLWSTNWQQAWECRRLGRTM